MIDKDGLGDIDLVSEANLERVKHVTIVAPFEQPNGRVTSHHDRMTDLRFGDARLRWSMSGSTGLGDFMRFGM